MEVTSKTIKVATGSRDFAMRKRDHYFEEDTTARGYKVDRWFIVIMKR